MEEPVGLAHLRKQGHQRVRQGQAFFPLLLGHHLETVEELVGPAVAIDPPLRAPAVAHRLQQALVDRTIETASRRMEVGRVGDSGFDIRVPPTFTFVPMY